MAFLIYKANLLFYMKYIKLFENFDSYDPYELMMIPPNKKAEMIVGEIKKSKPNLNLVSDLITLGANVNWQDEENYNSTPLHVVSIFGSVEIARMLIDAGADLNVQDKDGWTPLHDSARFGIVEIVRMLIDAGANKDIQNNAGKLPYELATNQEMKTILQP
jgi:ankyrin repeat protein